MAQSPFLLDLVAKCNDVKIERTHAARIENEIAEYVQLDTLTSYYISTSPIPGFAETKLDVFLLTASFIYNCEVNTEFDCRWFTIPLTSISYMGEHRSPYNNEFWALLIGVRSLPMERGVVILQSKFADRDRIRKFANACRDNLSALMVGTV